MTERQKLLAFIASCTGPEQLRVLMHRARDRGETEVAKAAFKKLVSIVQYDFWKAINATEQMLSDSRGKTTRLARTRQKVGRVGIIQVLIDWALVPVGQETEGFRMLIDWQMPELTGEAIVLHHPNSFDQHILDAARKRLENVGVDVDKMLGNLREAPVAPAI
jgi:hypothetical protein